jgi:DMSO reductase anchor subunit
MHPAPSIIVFTTLSGLGFGLMAFLGLGMPSSTGWVALAFYVIAYALACGGLLASAFHLGHPERALRAFSQWRSSWLSREAWLAVLTLLVVGVFAAGRVFWGQIWQPLGWIGAALALATVYSTSMIYASLAAIPRWHGWLTPLHFLSLALAGGALLAGQVGLALPLLALAAGVQLVTWMQGDTALARSGTTLASATGLQGGAVRAFEPPHTGTNYLLREMVHIVGRKHAARLRVLALILGFGLPMVLLVLPFNHWLGLLAVLTHVVGIFTSRWLFFAQAEHVVGLYYGKRSA